MSITLLCFITKRTVWIALCPTLQLSPYSRTGAILDASEMLAEYVDGLTRDCVYGGILRPEAIFSNLTARSKQVDVVTYDYSGYGMATGEPSEKNLYADSTAVYQVFDIHRHCS